MDDAMLKQRLSEVDTLISTGKWTGAFALAAINALNPELVNKAHARFQLALIAGLSGDDEKRTREWIEAKRCSDYTHEMEGDFYRREAIELVKRGRVKDAQLARDAAEGYYKDDRDGLTALISVQGRIDLARGNYATALVYHGMADRLWGELGEDATYQWRVENLLHWLAAALMSGRREEAHRVFPVLLREERDARRRNVAKVMMSGGKPACRLLFMLPNL